MPANKFSPIPPWATAQIEPKRKFKFFLTIGDVPAWVIKTTDRPTLTVTDGAKHNFLAHEFKFPGRITWGDVNITLMDPIDPDLSQLFLELVQEAGYTLPSDWNELNEGWKRSLAKRKYSDVVGDIGIQTLDADGKKVDEWKLKNAWIKEVSFDDGSYESEDIMQIKVALRYDYATHQSFV